jgi:hypothetical protein
MLVFFRLSCVSLAVIAFLWCPVDTAVAAISDTSASLSFLWDRTSSDIAWSASGPGSFNGADATYNEVPASDYQSWNWGWGSPGTPAAATVTPSAIGTATSSDSSITATGHAAHDGTATGTTSASGTSHLRRDFTFVGSGSSFAVDITYALKQDFTANLPGETAGGYSIAEISLWDDSLPVGQRQLKIWQTVLDNSENDVSNTLTLIVPYEGFTLNNNYSLEGHVYSSATAFAPKQDLPTVPVPGAILLLGSGLVSLFGIGRRRGLDSVK